MSQAPRPDALPADELPSPLVDLAHVKLVLEAALLSTQEPLPIAELRKLFEQDLSADTLRRVLEDLRADWAGRAVELTAVASGWRFRVKPQYAPILQRLRAEKPPRYSRAVLETLAIIAYRQPVTRGDIEQIRGVAVGTPIVKALEERGWIEAVGHREVPGRPALYATTQSFLDDLNLRSLEELPPLDELQSSLEMSLPEVPLAAPGGHADGPVAVAAEESPGDDATRALPHDPQDPDPAETAAG